jgi:putative flippase GtrA
MKINLNQFGRFGVAGIFVTLLSCVSFPFMYEIIFDKNFFTLSFIIAGFVNVTTSYVLQRIFVFKSTKKWLTEYIHFWLNASLLMIAAFILLYVLVHWGSFSPLVSNLFVVAVSAILSYVVHNSVTFRKLK